MPFGFGLNLTRRRGKRCGGFFYVCMVPVCILVGMLIFCPHLVFFGLYDYKYRFVLPLSIDSAATGP